MFFSKSGKEFEMTHGRMAVYYDRMSGMHGKRMECIAMFELTGEAIYQVSLKTIEQAIKKLEKVIERGVRLYKKNGRTHRAIQEHEAFQVAYEMAVLQMQLKKHPSRAESILEKMLALTVEGDRTTLRLHIDF